MFTGAISNLESRLDTILADETDPAARQRLTEQAQKDTKARQRAGSGTSTPASGARASQDPREHDRAMIGWRKDWLERLRRRT